MGHLQLPTSIQVDNSTANGTINSNSWQRKLKVIGMRFYWVQDRVRQNNMWCIGSQEETTKLTTSPNIICYLTIVKCKVTTSTYVMYS
eukprot:1624558-Ditylum_brightwellii.AAC.2